MKLVRELERAILLLQGREPERFFDRGSELRRGGLPSQSFGVGVSGGDWVWPIDDHGFGRDAFDRLLDQADSEYGELVQNVLRASVRLQAVENERLLTRLPFNVPEPVAVKCANPSCDDALEGGLRSGECDKCRKYRSRYGRAWAPKVHVNPQTGEMVG